MAGPLATLTKSESDYLSWHSVALCYVACRIFNLMTWDSPFTHLRLNDEAANPQFGLVGFKASRLDRIAIWR